jgi:hypothetical protein
MNTQVKKLELIRLLLDTHDQQILAQIGQLLKHHSDAETEYLLSEEANKKHLEKGIEQARQKKYNAVDPDNLWK